MFLNKSKFILWIALFFFSCEKGVIIIDPVAPKLTFDKLSKNYTAGGQYTTAEILANVKGNKTGYTLKEITNLEPNDVVTVNGSSPTPSLTIQKIGVFTATLILEHKEKPDATITGAQFEITKSAPTIIWEKQFGGSGAFAGAEDMVQAKDGNYVVAGFKNVSSVRQPWIMKLNENGGIVWERVITSSNRTTLDAIIQTKDDGYVVAGYRLSGAAMSTGDSFVAKLNSNGVVQWQKSFGPPAAYDDANSIIQTQDGGYLVASEAYDPPTKNTYILLLKINSSGSKQWEKTFSKSPLNKPYKIINTKDGGYALASIHEVKDNEYSILLLKLDNNANEQWSKYFTDTGCTAVPRDLIQTQDGGYAMVGGIEGKGKGDNSFWLVKTDTNGNKEWDKTFGTVHYDMAHSVVQTNDGGYALVGGTNSGGSLLIKTDGSGNKQWDKRLRGAIGREVLKAMIQTKDGAYVMAGNKLGMGTLSWWVLKVK